MRKNFVNTSIVLNFILIMANVSFADNRELVLLKQYLFTLATLQNVRHVDKRLWRYGHNEQ